MIYFLGLRTPRKDWNMATRNRWRSMKFSCKCVVRPLRMTSAGDNWAQITQDSCESFRTRISSTRGILKLLLFIFYSSPQSLCTLADSATVCSHQSKNTDPERFTRPRSALLLKFRHTSETAHFRLSRHARFILDTYRLGLGRTMAWVPSVMHSGLNGLRLLLWWTSVNSAATRLRSPIPEANKTIKTCSYADWCEEWVARARVPR